MMGAFFYGGEDRIRTCDRGFRPGNRLAGGPIRPLWHLPKFCVAATSLAPKVICLANQAGVVAFAIDDLSRHYRRMVSGGSGIRTHVGVTQTCFQDMRLQPLGHPSRRDDFTINKSGISIRTLYISSIMFFASMFLHSIAFRRNLAIL